MAQAVIEATLRDLETQDYKTKAKTLFEGDIGLERIRSIRDELLHPQAPGSPSLLWVGGFAASHAALENDAKRAVELMVKAICAHYRAPNVTAITDAVERSPSGARVTEWSVTDPDSPSTGTTSRKRDGQVTHLMHRRENRGRRRPL